MTACHRTGEDRIPPNTDRTGWSYQRPQDIVSSLCGKLEPTSYSTSSSSSLCSVPGEKLQTLFLHSLPTKEPEPFREVDSMSEARDVGVQVYTELLLWVAEGQVDLKAVLVWARPVFSAG